MFELAISQFIGVLGHVSDLPGNETEINLNLALVAQEAASELTHIKCYRGGEVDEGSTDTLTHIRGYPSPEHEFVCQTRVPGPHSRPL